MKEQTVQVGELALNDSGAFKIGPFGSSLKKSELVDSGIPVVGIENVLPNKFVKGFRRFITPRKFEDLSGYEILPDDVLVTTMGTIGRAASAPADLGRAIFDSHLFRMRVDTSRVFPSYLCYALNSDLVASQLARMARGAIMEGLNTTILRDCSIPLPELPEQERIAGRLEQADRLRRTRHYALELTDTFLPAAFLEFFGRRLKSGPFRPFGELVKITGGGTPARERPEFYRGRIPWLTSKDMKGDFIWDTEEHITDEAIEKSATNLVPAESILVVVKSKVLMHRLPVAIAKVPLCHGQDIKSIQCSGNLRPEFARFVLKFHEWRLLKLARGANTEGLTLPMLTELPVPTVRPAEQEQFAELVTRHERLRAVQRESLRQTEHLFASLLHRAFSG
ncbi:MAG: hypothetical protein A3H28_08920 [Acidobacteria bacterium RIFCSPLOWO2_02_FULL_61_28]|nr:MAG: hypothetical protein A3H28_08920 [Acidobacteria bacterium RIFCSPLOWO2_02_FULL_61_28]